MIPNKQNFCGGNFQDWLEVNLIDKCNGKCQWCIEKNGYHPKYHASWHEIVEQIVNSKKKNIILLGGEPLLYKNLKLIIKSVSLSGQNVWITTNGGLLSKKFIYANLRGIKGINISIHHYDLKCNKKITGVMINNIKEIINSLHKIGANIRLNCNCITGQIDSISQIEKYIIWAKQIGADKIRFAELKQDDNGFVDLAKILNYKYGLNDNPFICGCNSDAIINGIPVNFRQMCGLQTSRREKPENPIQCVKQVLYYDGKFYKGWQTINKGEDMSITQILEKLKKGEITEKEAEELINKIKTKTVIKEVDNGGGCQY